MSDLARKIFDLLGHCDDIYCSGWNSPNCGCRRRATAAAMAATESLSARMAYGIDVNDKTMEIRRSGFEHVVTLSILRLGIFAEIARHVPDPISDDRLVPMIWPNEHERGPTPLDALKAHIFYINSRIATLNLLLRKVRGFGYMLIDAPTAEMTVQATAEIIKGAI